MYFICVHTQPCVGEEDVWARVCQGLRRDVVALLCACVWGCVSGKVASIRMRSTRAPYPGRDWHIASSLSPHFPSPSHHPRSLQPCWKREFPSFRIFSERLLILQCYLIPFGC